MLHACRELDYVPNSAARALSTNKTRTIAAIIPTIEHSVFAKFVSAIEHKLGDHNYSLVIAISNADPNEELAAANKLIGLGAEAFIITGAQHRIELFNLFERRHTPFVQTSIWEPNNPNPTIGYDNQTLAANAVKHLADRGHENIAIIHGPLAQSDRTVARIQGAKSACSDRVNATYLETELSVAGGRLATTAFLKGDQTITALLCFSDVLALGAYFAIAEAGLKIPDDLSVMGFDNLDWSEHATPPLTTINLPARRMGTEVATQLVAHLDSASPLDSIELQGEIIERSSVKRLSTETVLPSLD